MVGLHFLCGVRLAAFLGFRLVLGTNANILGRRLSLQLFRLSLRKCEVQVGDACLWGKQVFPLASFSFRFTHAQNNNDTLLRFIKALRCALACEKTYTPLYIGLTRCLPCEGYNELICHIKNMCETIQKRRNPLKTSLIPSRISNPITGHARQQQVGTSLDPCF